MRSLFPRKVNVQEIEREVTEELETMVRSGKNPPPASWTLLGGLYGKEAAAAEPAAERAPGPESAVGDLEDARETESVTEEPAAAAPTAEATALDETEATALDETEATAVDETEAPARPKRAKAGSSRARSSSTRATSTRARTTTGTAASRRSTTASSRRSTS